MVLNTDDIVVPGGVVTDALGVPTFVPTEAGTREPEVITTMDGALAFTPISAFFKTIMQALNAGWSISFCTDEVFGDKVLKVTVSKETANGECLHRDFMATAANLAMAVDPEFNLCAALREVIRD